jgi:hypothetical protein
MDQGQDARIRGRIAGWIKDRMPGSGDCRMDQGQVAGSGVGLQDGSGAGLSDQGKDARIKGGMPGSGIRCQNQGKDKRIVIRMPGSGM